MVSRVLRNQYRALMRGTAPGDPAVPTCLFFNTAFEGGSLRAVAAWDGVRTALTIKYGPRALSAEEAEQDLRALVSKTTVFVRLTQVGVLRLAACVGYSVCVSVRVYVCVSVRLHACMSVCTRVFACKG